MSISLDSELEARLKELAAKQGVTPEALALSALRQRFLKSSESEDAWVRLLRSAASDCGVSPPNEAFLAENLYD